MANTERMRSASRPNNGTSPRRRRPPCCRMRPPPPQKLLFAEPSLHALLPPLPAVRLLPASFFGGTDTDLEVRPRVHTARRQTRRASGSIRSSLAHNESLLVKLLLVHNESPLLMSIPLRAGRGSRVRTDDRRDLTSTPARGPRMRCAEREHRVRRQGRKNHDRSHAPPPPLKERARAPSLPLPTRRDSLAPSLPLPTRRDSLTGRAEGPRRGRPRRARGRRWQRPGRRVHRRRRRRAAGDRSSHNGTQTCVVARGSPLPTPSERQHRNPRAGGALLQRERARMFDAWLAALVGLCREVCAFLFERRARGAAREDSARASPRLRSDRVGSGAVAASAARTGRS